VNATIARASPNVAEATKNPEHPTSHDRWTIPTFAEGTATFECLTATVAELTVKPGRPAANRDDTTPNRDEATANLADLSAGSGGPNASFARPTPHRAEASANVRESPTNFGEASAAADDATPTRECASAHA
jgi:hypothetical protein